MFDRKNKMYNELVNEGNAIAKDCYPAFDSLLSYSLERRHLDIPEIKSVFIASGKEYEGMSLQEHLKENVRMFKIDEISFDSDESIHLPGVESAITSMRGQGHSLVFVVQGDTIKTSVYLGLSKFAESALDINAALESYSAAWKANFPGTQLNIVSTNDLGVISSELANCREFGVLTGIPSLKREEESNLFVQGLERLIRAMRGKTYCWISIADPIPHDIIRDAIDACQRLQTDVHHLVKTDISKATSKGKTVMLGGFGMMGQGTTDGTSHTDSASKTHTISDTHTTSKSTSSTHTQSKLEGYQRVSSAVSAATPILGIAGAVIGTFICPGIGTAIGAGLGSLVGQSASSAVNGIGAAVTGKNGFSDSTSTSSGTSDSHTESISDTTGYADTVSRAVAQQFGGGGFASYGMSWTKTTTVGQELLNRKLEYTEEILKAYETRLHEGVALGMWNLGHYFCASDEETYSQGIGVVTSLFTGMDSTFEPPRAIKMPEDFRNVLRRFNNIYLRFSTEIISQEKLKKNQQYFKDHPLGFIFNGPCTPVNTKELAIATPIPTQDIEGVTVSERAKFAINMPVQPPNTKTLTLGRIMDKGNVLSQRYRLKLENLNKHLSIFGLTGSGKTNTTQNLLIQLWTNHRIPFMVLEPAKSEYRSLSRIQDLKDDLLVISAGINQTSVCPLRINPFDFEPGCNTDANRVHLLTHIDRLKATFNASFPMYASMPYILEEAILEVYRDRGWDLGRSENRYVDIYNDDFSQYIPTLHDLYLKIDEVVQRKGYYQEQRMNIQAALKSRLSSLMVGAKGEMFNSLHSISSNDLFNRPVIIELENLGDDDEKCFIMGLLVAKLYEHRKATFDQSNSNGLFKHILVIEEAHRLLANIPDTSANMEAANVKGKAISSFVDMLSEIRALGQSVAVVDQLPSRVSPNIIKGTGSKIVHRLLAKDDREAVGWTMGLNEDQINDLNLLKTGECIVSQDGDRKSFMCLVGKSPSKELNGAEEDFSATIQYKAQHTPLFDSPSSYIDLEDMRFRNELYKTMLAIGIGQPPDQTLIHFNQKQEQTNIYWKQICGEIWSFYGGNYKKYLDLFHAGKKLFISDSSLAEYRNSRNLNTACRTACAGTDEHKYEHQHFAVGRPLVKVG